MKIYLTILLSIIYIFPLFAQRPYKAEVAFIIPEKDLIPEGIAFDNKSGNFYISSVFKNKIIEVDKLGKHRDLIQSNQEGFLNGIGMKVDKKRILWANSAATSPEYRGSGLFCYDLKTSKLVRKIMVPGPANQVHLLNDLVLDKKGNAYLTDTEHSTVHFLAKNASTFVPFLDSSQVQYPNGIALSAKQNKLYVATHFVGIKVVDLVSKKVQLLESSDNFVAQGIDGLMFYKNSLIAIMNYESDLSQHKILRFYLDKTGTKITHWEAIDKNNPHFHVPTTGVIVGNQLFVIANSYLDYIKDGQITEPDKLKETVVLKYQLD